MTRIHSLLVATALLLAGAAHADEGARIALLIGNADYGSAPLNLNSPEHDVDALGKRLHGLEFDEVIRLKNATRSDVVRAVKRARTLAEGGTIFLFYSGHAIQIDGTNWLIPVGANIKTLGDVQIEAVAVRHILNQFDRAELRIAILDACRNNPFGVGAKSLGSSGLARTRLGGLSGTIISFAAAPGTVAYDGKPGETSPYTRALLGHMLTPGLGLNEIFMNVRGDLSDMTRDGANGPQRSEEVSSLTQRDRFFFRAAAKLGGTKSKPKKLAQKNARHRRSHPLARPGGAQG